MLGFKYSKNLKIKGFACHRPRILHFPFTRLPWLESKTLDRLQLPKNFERICVVGIGGSSSGAKALASAMEKTNIIFLDNIDPDFVEMKLKSINLKKTLFILISKSGETTEIIFLASLIFSRVASPDNFLVITDNNKGSLGKFARKNRIPVFQSPADIPGRFSVLSIVGLLPAALAGISTQKILDAAKQVKWKSAFQLAYRQYCHFLKKKNICVFFSYSERLSDFADWYIQLLAESIGKSKRVGITPLKALGVKDQHSQLQLFLDGPDDKFYILLKPEKPHAKIPKLSKLFNAEYEGTKKALLKKGRMFAEISFPEISAETLGALLFFFELEIAFLGSLLKINIENQPAVELGKKFTKSIL